MKQFKDYLKEFGEVGFIEEIQGSTASISGLPSLLPEELVIFETGGFGQVMSLDDTRAGILLIDAKTVGVGTRVARTNSWLEVPVGPAILGQSVSALGMPLMSGVFMEGNWEYRLVDQPPPNIQARQHIEENFETGVSIVDLLVPLGKGQRELVIGDSKVGKRAFLLQALLSQSQRGGITIYALIAKRQSDVISLQNFVREHGLSQQVVIVSSVSTDMSGMIFLTPYTAMTIAEYFRDQDKDVLVILDDLTIHAKYYREIALVSKRFPGRDSYPGDIFYAHARLLERSGNFTQGSITCLPVADSVMGDIAGYIQTNLMSMTDGHIFFDAEIQNQGLRPAVNPFLSVTRVGYQAQTDVIKVVSQELRRFLINYHELQQLQHFGGEVSPEAKRNLERGDRLSQLFNQSDELVVPIPVTAAFAVCLWASKLDAYSMTEIRQRIQEISLSYMHNSSIRNQLENMIEGKNNFDQLVQSAQEITKIIMG